MYQLFLLSLRPHHFLISSGFSKLKTHYWGWDNTVRLWDVARGVCERVLVGHTDSVECICYSVDGKTLASGSYDCTVRLWDVASGHCIAKANCGVSVLDCQWEPSGKPYLVSAHDEGSMRYWLLKKEENSALCSLELRWTSRQKVLVSAKADFEGAAGLSESNAKLLEQRGGLHAKATSVPQTRPAFLPAEEKETPPLRSPSRAHQAVYNSRRTQPRPPAVPRRVLLKAEEPKKQCSIQ